MTRRSTAIAMSYRLAKCAAVNAPLVWAFDHELWQRATPLASLSRAH
jgi:hypothetical protein